MRAWIELLSFHPLIPLRNGPWLKLNLIRIFIMFASWVYVVSSWANYSLCIPGDTRILKYNLQCVQTIRKYLLMHWKWQKCELVRKWGLLKKNHSFNVALKGANDSYAYSVILEYLNITYSVSKKSESTYFCTRNCQNVNYSENEPSWKKFALSMWLLRQLMIPYVYPVMLEYLIITYSVSKKSESTDFCTKNGQNVSYSENEPSWKKTCFLNQG